MEYQIAFVCYLLASYLSGSAPFGFWLAKVAKGNAFDIRDWGSQNIGFTNVKGVLGWRVGAPVLVLDVAKGLVLPLMCKHLLGDVAAAFCVLAAGIGHSRSIFFYLMEGEFSGGKAVATLCGGAFALDWRVGLSAFAVWMVILLLSDYMSLASLCAAYSAPILAYAFGLSTPLFVFFCLVPIVVTATHWRNIGRLIHKVEPKFSQRRGAHDTGDETVVAFGIHSRDLDDLKQLPFGRIIMKAMETGVLSKKAVLYLIKKSPVLEVGEISGIVAKGRKVRVLLLGIPMTPDQIKDPKNKKLLKTLLNAAAALAQRRGATVFGLGGLLSAEANGGKDTAQWCKGRGLTIQIDNGAANTVSATLIALEKALAGRSLCELVVATFGARGLIGHSLYNNIAQQVKEALWYLRGKSSRSDRPILIGQVLSSEDLAQLPRADLVFCCTSSPVPILTRDNCHLLKEGCTVLDVAYPPDFDDKILEIRPDIKLFRCGLIKLPGENVTCPIDFHFGSDNGVPLFPACLIQAIILGLTRAFEHASLAADITQEDIAFFKQASGEYGFEAIVSPYSEQQLYTGEINAE